MVQGRKRKELSHQTRDIWAELQSGSGRKGVLCATPLHAGLLMLGIEDRQLHCFSHHASPVPRSQWAAAAEWQMTGRWRGRCRGVAGRAFWQQRAAATRLMPECIRWHSQGLSSPGRRRKSWMWEFYVCWWGQGTRELRALGSMGSESYSKTAEGLGASE